MLSITYLSNKDRERLLDLREELNKTIDPEEHSRLKKEIQLLEGKSKPLKECSYSECQELKTHIYEKYEKMLGIGKTNPALQLKNMIVQVELRIQTLLMSEENFEKPKDKKNARRSEDSQREDQGSEYRNPWTGRSNDIY